MTYIHQLLELIIKAFEGKLVNYMARLLPKWKKGGSALKFYNPVVAYLYSYYDEMGNHVLQNGVRELYQSHFSLTVHNLSKDLKIMRDVQLIGTVEGIRYKFNLYDKAISTWKRNYNIRTGTMDFFWYAMPEGHGMVSGDPGVIALNGNTDEIQFDFIYTDEKNKVHTIPITVKERHRLNPRLISA